MSEKQLCAGEGGGGRILEPLTKECCHIFSQERRGERRRNYPTEFSNWYKGGKDAHYQRKGTTAEKSSLLRLLKNTSLGESLHEGLLQIQKEKGGDASWI